MLPEIILVISLALWGIIWILSVLQWPRPRDESDADQAKEDIL
jgi:hypothetical protein